MEPLCDGQTRQLVISASGSTIGRHTPSGKAEASAKPRHFLGTLLTVSSVVCLQALMVKIQMSIWQQGQKVRCQEQNFLET